MRAGSREKSSSQTAATSKTTTGKNDWGQYKAAIDGLDIHFLHARSKHENALPLIITHGWPGSGYRRALIGAVKAKRKEKHHD
jgi:epoxide hydrolase-like protein